MDTIAKNLKNTSDTVNLSAEEEEEEEEEEAIKEPSTGTQVQES